MRRKRADFVTSAAKRQSRRPLARKRRIRNTTRIAGPPSVAAVLARTRTFAIAGLEAVPVDVEIDINRGLPTFSIVGLPDAAVRESRERVRAALVNSGFEFPLQRITANLAPADLRKAGPGFDLAIAAAILAASGQLDSAALADRWLAGELALDGAIRPLPGVLAMAERAERERAERFVVAAANAAEARLVEGLDVIAVGALSDLRAIASGEIPARCFRFRLSRGARFGSKCRVEGGCRRFGARLVVVASGDGDVLAFVKDSVRAACCSCRALSVR